MVFKRRPVPEETEERQLSQDVRYSETDKEDLFFHALESLCKLKIDMENKRRNVYINVPIKNFIKKTSNKKRLSCIQVSSPVLEINLVALR